MSIQSISGSGQQPDDQTIYSEYTDISGYIDSLIHNLDEKYATSQNDPKYIQERNALLALKQDPNSFLSAYQKDYQIAHNPNATQAERDAAAADFDAIYNTVKKQADAIVNGGTDPKTQIENDQEAAQALKDKLDGLIKQDKSALDQITAWERQIAALEGQIEKLPPGPDKDQATADLTAAKAKLTALEGKASALKADLSTLEALQEQEAADIGQFADLLKDPTDANAKIADALLSGVKGFDTQVTAAQTDFASKAPTTKDIAAMNALIKTVQDDLDPSAAIKKDETAAQKSIDAMKAAIKQDKQDLAQIAIWEEQIKELEAEKPTDKARTDLDAAEAMLKALQSAYATASADLQTLEANELLAEGNIQQFSSITTKAAADALLAKINALNTQPQFTKDMPSKDQIAAMSAAIQKVKDDLNPPAPKTDIENSVWVKNWGPMPDLNDLPPGVNTINLFVGALDFVNGKWIIDQCGQMTNAQIKAYVAAAHAKGINVKLSIGGAGGQAAYNNTWDQITDGNVEKMGQDLADFCKSEGLDGVDFDYEEQKSSAQRKQVGELIKAFKTADPTLQASVCTCADEGWAKDLGEILDAAGKNADGSSLVDRIYVMSYDFGQIGGSSAATEQAEEKFMTDWATFAAQYGISHSQISLGTDPGDGTPAHPGDGVMTVADREKLLKFAADEGFSTALWDQLDYQEKNYTQKVHDIYWTEYDRVHPHGLLA